MRKRKKEGNPTFDVVWLQSGKVKEVLDWNKPLALARYLRNKARYSTHRTGELYLRNNETKELTKL